MSGFRVAWYLEDENGSRVRTSEVQKPNNDWKEVEDSPKQLNEVFRKMVGIALTKRLSNMTMDDIIKDAILLKINLLKSDVFGKRDCQNEKIPDSTFDHFIHSLSAGKSHETLDVKISEKDIEAGLALYMIGLHCPKETLKLSQFLLRLSQEESLPSFILATVNTLQSSQLTLVHKRMLGRIYQVLDDFFELSLPKVLLATSSPKLLKSLQDLNLPFLNESDQQIQQCLSGLSCTDVFNHNQGIETKIEHRLLSAQ